MKSHVKIISTGMRLACVLVLALLCGTKGRAQVMTLTVNVGATAFNATYPSAYSTDLVMTQAAQLTATSTGRFALAVRANTQNLSSGGNTLPLDVIKIGLTNSNMGAVPFPAVPLTNYSQTLVTNALSTVAVPVDVQYTLLTRTKFSTFTAKPAGAYSTSLIFTISAP